MGVIENLAKNPAVLIIAAVGIVAFIFRDKISDFLSNITGGAATANILGENFLSNLEGTQNLLNNITDFFTNFEFPTFDFEFPTFDFELPTFNFDDFFRPPVVVDGLPLPEDVENTGLLTPEERAKCNCGTSITQDIQGDVSEVCLPCDDHPPLDTGELPVCVDFPVIGVGMINSCTGVITPFGEGTLPEEFIESASELEGVFEPEVVLQEGFEGGGLSFEGGTIFEIPLCNMSIGEIAQKFGISASAAADKKFQECETSDFDFGTNTGSGFGAGDDQSGGIVTGGATLESEEKKAACVSCELFGLNCPLCAGTI